ncbi:MAG: hypothetical protein ACREJT_14390, partial [Myxococcota bacterium]
AGLSAHAHVELCDGSPTPALIDPVVRRASDYVRMHWADLVDIFPALHGMPRPRRGHLPDLRTDVWCEILAQAYAQLDADGFRRVRDHLVGLFPARVISWWHEIEGRSATQVDALLCRQNRRLAELFATRDLPDDPQRVGDPALIAGPWAVTGASGR